MSKSEFKNFKLNLKKQRISGFEAKAAIKDFLIKMSQKQEKRDLEIWSVKKKIYKNTKGQKSLKPLPKKMSFLQRRIALTTYNHMNSLGYGAYEKVGPAVMAITPLMKEVFLLDQGKTSWLNQDLFFNSIEGLEQFTNVIDWLNGDEKNKSFKNHIRGEEISELIFNKAIGAAQARNSIYQRHYISTESKVFIYLELKQIDENYVRNALDFIKSNNLNNIVFIISSYEDDTEEKLNYAKKLMKFRNIKVHTINQFHSNFKTVYKNTKLNKASTQAVFHTALKGNDSHFEYSNIKDEVTSSDLKKITIRYNLVENNFLDEESTPISNYRINVRKRVSKSLMIWNGLTLKETDKFKKAKIDSKRNYKFISKTQITKKINSTKILSLKTLNDKIEKLVTKENPNFFVNRDEKTASMDVLISTGLSLYGQRSIIHSHLYKAESLVNSLRTAEKLNSGAIIILRYDRRKIDGLDIKELLSTFRMHLDNVFNISNEEELVAVWLIAQKNHNKITVIIIDEAPMSSINTPKGQKIGFPSQGGYIIKKRPYVTKPVNYILYGTGTVINEIAHLVSKIEKINKSTNLQVVSLSNINKVSEDIKRKLLPSTTKKIRFQTSGLVEKIQIIKETPKHGVVLIPPSTWRNSNYLKEIEKIII